jgi:hypothetical protein
MSNPSNHNYIYIGLSIPPLGLKTNALSNDPNPPSTLASYIAVKPMLAVLYIHTSQLSAAKQRITTKGTIEYIANQEMLAIARTIPR